MDAKAECTALRDECYAMQKKLEPQYLKSQRIAEALLNKAYHRNGGKPLTLQQNKDAVIIGYTEVGLNHPATTGEIVDAYRRMSAAP